MSKLLIYIVIFSAFIFGYIKYLERRGIYYPIKEISFTPQDINLPFEDAYFTTEDNLRLNAWLIPKADSKYTIMLFHGNAGNIGDRIDKIKLLYDAGASIFIVDYRGYGKSRGSPSEEGFYKDAIAAYNYLVNERKIDSRRIVLYGESIGNAVAIHLAAQVKTKALIVEGGFSRGRDMAKTIYPFLPNFLFADSFDCIAKIKSNNTPKLFLHSRQDEIVPFELAKKLFDAAPQPKEFVELIGGHNTAFLDSGQLYPSSVKAFLEKI